MSIVCLVLVASVQANPVPEADAKVIVLVWLPTREISVGLELFFCYNEYIIQKFER